LLEVLDAGREAFACGRAHVAIAEAAAAGSADRAAEVTGAHVRAARPLSLSG
jgi:DNA-binding GntR family transcriptional regulator